MFLHPLTNFIPTSVQNAKKCSIIKQGPYQWVFTVRYSERGRLQTNNYILRRGQTGDGKDDPGLLYHQPATEDLSQPSFTEHTGYMIHDESL